jgi:hypothetical protein
MGRRIPQCAKLYPSPSTAPLRTIAQALDQNMVPALHSSGQTLYIMDSQEHKTTAIKGNGMRALLASLFLAMLISIPASAQITGSRTGWIMFDDSVAKELELRDRQLERLHVIDRRYQEDYERLGDDPRSDPNYLALTERRNAEIQTVLDAEQYERWMRINDYDYEQGRMRVEPGPGDTRMDRRDPRGREFEMDHQRTNVGTAPTPKTDGGTRSIGAGGVGNQTGTDGVGGPR